MQLFAAVLVCCLAPASGGSSQVQPPPAKTAPSISASPNPVPAGFGAGTSTITWSTGDGTEGRVQVSVNGGIEEPFARGPFGSAPAPWITSTDIFEFRLYFVNAPGIVAARVTVTRDRLSAKPIIAVDPNPLPAGSGLGTVTITWATGNRTEGEVMVATNGRDERIVTRGSSGSLPIKWIDRASHYEFRLYSTKEPRTRLGSVTILPTAKPGAAASAPRTGEFSAILTAHPNPVPIGFGRGRAQIAWDVGEGTTGRLTASTNGGPEKELARVPRGALNADWIAGGSVYEFKLYADQSGPEPLASLTVRTAGWSSSRWLILTGAGVLVVLFAGAVVAWSRRTRRA